MTFPLEFLPPEILTLGRAISTQPNPLDAPIYEENGVHYPVREIVSATLL